MPSVAAVTRDRTAKVIVPPTDAQLARLKAQYLPTEAQDNGWDDAKVLANWTGGIAGTIRAYWYDRVQQTAGYMDLPDPGGTLPITQLHLQAKAMLEYWDNWLLKYGDETTADGDLIGPMRGRVSFGKIRRRYKNNSPFPMPIGGTIYSPYKPTD